MKTEHDFIKPQEYKAIQIMLASPEQILSWSHGEIKTSETINYRTFKPEQDGLFCGKIFGPVKDYECVCGKYKRMKHRGITCEKCGVEVIESKVRRERMGHIKLSSPVSHVWFLKGLPSRISAILDIPLKDLERVIYFDSYLVLEPGSSDKKNWDVIDENTYKALCDQNTGINAKMGAEAIQEIIGSINLREESETLRFALSNTNSETKRKKIIKRLKVIEAFRDSGINPKHMILDVIPVISPELRPLVPLEGGRFATSDLNDLYRRVIHRNNRLKRLLELSAPEIIVKNEKRMLQESVDSLFDNERRSRPILGTNKRPLKSLSDTLKGKYGRFRQNLLGKRVDYSGRTVIVVGPELKLNQCGVPKTMALELFKPFIFQHLMQSEKASTIKLAKKMVETQDPAVWAALDHVCREHPVILNRAPTLHRLGIQAFDPVLIEGKSIQLHPLVCAAFNADFDGDQMAIHVPLTIETQLEAKILMMATSNILSPATGKPIMTPTQDMVLGVYWMTKDADASEKRIKVYSSIEEVILAYEYEAVHLHSKIKVPINGVLIETTAGRVILYDFFPRNFEFNYINRCIKKKDLEDLIDKVFRVSGSVATVRVLDGLKDAGFHYSTKAGFSISMSDMVIPKAKETILKSTYIEVDKIHQEHQNGLTTDGERYNKVIDIWSRVTDEIANEMITALSEETVDEHGKPQLNSIFVMADSGARGSVNQCKQLGGMRGLMAKPTGEIIETPITQNFREGLSVHQYFISTHGARKGLADTALKTARSGYLTRRLVDVSQDCVVTTEDCGTSNSIELKTLVENGEIIEKLSERILGRVVAEDVINPNTDELIFPINTFIDEHKAEVVENSPLDTIQIYSVLTCEAEQGVCKKCYGRDLGRGSMINIGDAVGVIAAQSIGEPGTQLTMRTFHIGGTVNRAVAQTGWEPSKSGRLSLKDVKFLKNRENRNIVINRNSEAVILDEQGRKIEHHRLPLGAFVHFNENDAVEKGQTVSEWDPFSIPVITDSTGIIKYSDILIGKSMNSIIDDNTGIKHNVIIETKEDDLKPRILLRDLKTRRDLKKEDGKPHPGFYLPVGAEILVSDGDEVMAGDIIAKVTRETTKNKDITGGLPRVVDLFEARIPKDPCVISDIEGIVEFGENLKRKRRMIIKPDLGDPIEYLISRNKHIIVNEGDQVFSGEALTDGVINPHDILRVKGVVALQNFIVDEVQEVYRLQGVKINDKHIEVIIRQMLKKVRVVDSGDSLLLNDESLSKEEFNKINTRLEEEGRQKAVAVPLLLGITKSALNNESFIASASFQETTKVLTDAAINGAYDYLNGLKENVILGRLIPAGTGFNQNKNYSYYIENEKNDREFSFDGEEDDDLAE